MLATGRTPLIWPLLTKLMPMVACQRKPRYTAGRVIPMLPVMPWDDSDRPPVIGFGQVEGDPKMCDVIPVNFGLCAIRVQSRRLQDFVNPQRPNAASEQTREPAVVHNLVRNAPLPGPRDPPPRSDQKARSIIWPLLAKLHPTIAAQRKPRYTAGRVIPTLPVMPWDDGDRPPVVSYGTVESDPKVSDTLPVNFGLSALNLISVPLQNYLNPRRPNPISWQVRTPAVVRPWRTQPARIAMIGTIIDGGKTRDGTGAVLGNCVVELYLTATDEPLAKTTSDANGAYLFTAARYSPATHYIVAYKTGSPDKAGTSVNTITAS